MNAARAVYHVGPERVDVRESGLPPLSPTDVLVAARLSAISPGTESLIFRGQMPERLLQDETIPSLQGDFTYPFRYGYSLVGEVIGAGAGVAGDWIGRRVFVFHPHQDRVVVDHRDCLLIPDRVPMERAVFLANMESALNLVLDAHPCIGEKGMVWGQGVVGLLVLALLREFPLAELIAADPLPLRRTIAQEWGAGLTLDPADPGQLSNLRDHLFRADDGLDFAIEVSGRMEALDQAIQLSGFGGRIIIGSWYGRTASTLDLGSGFHRRRITLLSSQVSTISPALSGRWSKSRRLDLAWNCLRKHTVEQWVTHRFPLRSCQRAFEVVSNREENVIQAVFEYD